jgi:hypothetical protein
MFGGLSLSRTIGVSKVDGGAVKRPYPAAWRNETRSQAPSGTEV